MGRSKSQYHRKSLSFDIETFNQVVRQIEALAIAGGKVNPEDFYPPVRKHRGHSRDLPLIDSDLRLALEAHVSLSIEKSGPLKPTNPLFISQKGVPYSPNTLQERMAHMLRNWAGIEKASSQSGRRSVITNVIHKQKKSVKVAQKIAGQVIPSTTLIYEDPPEELIGNALMGL